MEEILTTILIIILLYIVYSYTIHMERKNPPPCSIIYKPSGEGEDEVLTNE